MLADRLTHILSTWNWQPQALFVPDILSYTTKTTSTICETRVNITVQYCSWQHWFYNDRSSLVLSVLLLAFWWRGRRCTATKERQYVIEYHSLHWPPLCWFDTSSCNLWFRARFDPLFATTWVLPHCLLCHFRSLDQPALPLVSRTT